MPTVAVCGCSFSDYCHIKRPYGVVFAEKIGYNYLHLAQGCGSNDRVIKEVVDAIITGKLVSGDLVIIQWPEPSRQETPTLFNDVEQLKQSYDGKDLDCVPPVRNSNIGEYAYYNFKIGLQDFKYPERAPLTERFKQKVMHQYTESLANLTAANETFFLHKWQVYHTLIESICKLNNIKLLIYWHCNLGIYKNLAEQILGKTCSTLMYTDRNILEKYGHSVESLETIMLGYDARTGIRDLSHYNDFGHSLVAENLFNHYLKIKDQL